MKRLVLLCALTSAVAASGCAEIQELSISSRNRSAAYAAWKAARWDYWRQGVPYRVREHIGRGFQEGYYEVAQGGTGKLPLFPPSYYWGVQFQSAAGNELIAAWFRGYQDGAMAAERDGIGGFRQIPSSYSGVGPMPGAPGTAPSFDPNQPAGPYDEPLPPPPSGPLTPVPPNLDPGPIVQPPLQEDVPLRTLDAPAFPAPPKPPAPPAVPNMTGPAPVVPGPTVLPVPGAPPGASSGPSAVPTPSAVPKSTAPAAPKPSATPSGSPPRIGSEEEPFGPVPGAIDLQTPPTLERPSTARIRTTAPGEVEQIEVIPADEPPYARQTLFAEPSR
jgi:hypothetical protein